MTAALDDPLASASGQFPLAPRTFPSAPEDRPSPIGLRPWGLRDMLEVSPPAASWRTTRYDHVLQVVVDNITGLPLPSMAKPTAITTASVDGEDPPSAEDWIND